MKKVFFIVVTVILAIFVGYISYNSSQYSHINELVDEAVSEKKYSEVAKIFGGCFDTNAIVEEENDETKLVVFNATAMIDLSYGESQRFQAYEEAYSIYLFDSNFNYSTYDSKNETALVFSDGTDSFKYPFIVSDAVNADLYKATKTTKEEAIFNEARNVTANETTWDFMYINLTKTMVEHIEYVIGNPITKLSLIDSTGEEVVSVDVALDFSQKFYSDMTELISKYNDWIEKSSNGNNSTANQEFNEFYEGWLTNFDADKDSTGYSLPYDQSYLAPTSLIWKSAGYIAIYAVVMLVFYILFFKLEAYKEKQTKKNVALAQAEIALQRQKKNENQENNEPLETEVGKKEE